MAASQTAEPDSAAAAAAAGAREACCEHREHEAVPQLAEVVTAETARTGARPVRIAFEGCGHGMLDGIYAAVTREAAARGWPDGVDVVIIGGDFQAVRNPADLTCLSVPPRFRRLGDFPAYYAGAKAAPYLTLFVGGNHEASNYLSELHYGGWVAPNIYYLGAANVVRFAGLRIAGLSGIFAPYDYGRPHFERLPYNANDAKSVYHTRQLDVRKLMQLRTPVDIVVSHDWPQGIEHHGDSRWLFRHKRGFEEDSRSGKLGSPAARDVLHRLRPKLWLSAHLHVKFEAVVSHGGYDPLSVFVPNVARRAAQKAAAAVAAAEAAENAAAEREVWMEKVRESAEKARQLELQNSSSGPVTPLPAVDIAEAAEPAAPPIAPTASAVPEHPIREADARQPDVPAAAAPETATAATAATKLSAWHSFHTVVGELDAAQEAAVLAASSATQDDPQNHHLTWKKVETGDDGLTRTGAEVTVYDIPHGRAAGTAAAGLQGGAQAMRLDGADADPSTTVTSGVDAPATGRAVAERNPDEIDLDLSDDDGGSDDDDAEGDAGSGVQLPDAKRVPVAATDAAGSAGNADAPPGTVHAPDSAATGARTEPTAAAEASRPAEMAGPAAAQPAASQDGATSAPRPDPAAPLNAMAKPFTMAAEPTAPPVKSSDGLSLPVAETAADVLAHTAHSPAGCKQSAEQPPLAPPLAVAAKTATAAAAHVVRSDGAVVATSLPPAITNTTTHFLSLDKIEEGRPRRFVDLLEVPLPESLSALQIADSDASACPAQPARYQLEYDPEWLAISKAMASELVFGGGPDDMVPPDRGDVEYLPSIEAARAWVAENVVAKGRLAIPHNFTMTASPITDFDDPEQTRIPKGMDVQEQPREFTNPQTAAFCDLLQISNAFDLSEEERQARREAGPRPEVHYDRPGKRQFSGPRGPGGGMRGGGYDRRPSRGRGRGGSGGGRRH